MLLAACLISAASWASAQVRVTGTVVSAEDGQPVVGASVIVPGTKVGVVTDLNGQFTLRVPEGHKNLRVSSIGMEPQEIAAKENVRIALQGNAKALNEVVVTAYGTSTKASFTGSAAVMDSKQIEQRQVSNVTNALSGAVAGVQILSNNGQPGVAAKVRIRGVGSINAGTEPLYVVDGVPYDGDVSSINPEDIESLTVLKDAASTAMYGARGANGIIMITTKKGKAGKATVNFTAKWGSNSRAVPNYDVLKSPKEYLERLYQSSYNYYLYNKGEKADVAMKSANNDFATFDSKTNAFIDWSGRVGYQIYTIPEGENMFGADGLLNPKATLGYSDGSNYYTPDNWEDEMFHNSLRQEYNASIAGGNDRSTFYGSFGYLNDNGVIENSGFKRYTGRLKADYKVFDWLKIGGNLAYTNTNSRYPDDQTATASSGNAFGIANNIAPIYPFYIRNAEGVIQYDNHYNLPIYDYGDGTYSAYSRKYMPGANPTGQNLYSRRDFLADVINLNWYGELTPVKGLTLTAKYGLSVNNTRYNQLLSGLYGQFTDIGGQAQQDQMRYYGFDQQYVANYQFNINAEHNFDITAGYDGYNYEETVVEALGSNLYNPDDYYVSNTIDQKTAAGSRDTYATVGYFGRINYNFKNTYFASFSYRRDGSSRFIGSNRWGNFFSGSAAWMISNEDFMKDVKWVNMLKLKASFGQQGNDDLLYSNVSALSYSKADGYARNFHPAYDQYRLTGANGVFSDATLYYKGNPDLTWETSTSYNIGVDFSLFNSRLNGSIEYFGRKSSDMLYNKPTTPILGYSSIPMNIGSMRNTGFELDLSYSIFNRRDFTWDVNLNATTVKNKIIKLHPDLNGQLIDGYRIYEEGKSMYRFYMVKYAGVDPETGEALYWAKDKDGKEYKTADWTVASETDKQATKDILPKVYGGFGTSLTYKGFDFSIQMAYQLGGTIYDYGYRRLMHGGVSSSAGTNWSTDIHRAWTPENKNTDVPRVDSGDSYTNSLSDRWLESSNYLSINNITFGYTLPESLTKKVMVSKLRLFFTADNVAFFSARKGLDPRQSYTDASSSTYSAIRTISGGINITF